MKQSSSVCLKLRGWNDVDYSNDIILYLFIVRYFLSNNISLNVVILMNAKNNLFGQEFLVI